jgi:gliding motility-associated-like protein
MPDAANPLRICYPAAGFYFITRKGANGVCEKEQSVRVEVGNRPDAFPNAFTPNGDGVNDVFRPLFRCPVLTSYFRVYNRWGQVVFESREPDAAWDGKTDGVEAASDVYAWQLEYEVLRDGIAEKRKEKGDVALLR